MIPWLVPRLRNPAQRPLHIRRIPPLADVRIRRDDRGGVVAAEAGDVAAGVCGSAAEIESRNRRAVGPRPGEGSIETHLVIGESSHQEVALEHIGQGLLGIGGAEGEAVEEGRVIQVGRIAAPELQQIRAMAVAFGFPVPRVAALGVGQLFPHEGGVHAIPTVIGVKVRRT